MTPSVSVVIPAHGHAGMTKACADAVLACAPPETEVLVVDDATEPPLETALTWDPRVRHVRAQQNLRFAGACNLGAESSTAPTLLFLNNDVMVTTGVVEQLVACIDDGAAVVGARLLYADGTVQHAGICFSQVDAMPRHVYRGFPGDHSAVTGTRPMQAVTAACLMISRAAFEELDGFDTGFVNGFEDVDLCLRAAQSGAQVVYCGGAAATHLESVSVRLSDDQTEAIAANAKRFREKWPDVRPDEAERYALDGLIRIAPDDVYPLAVEIDPLLGVAVDPTEHAIPQLLNTRSRQVFDLEKDVGRLAAQLLDNGIEPTL